VVWSLKEEVGDPTGHLFPQWFLGRSLDANNRRRRDVETSKNGSSQGYFHYLKLRDVQTFEMINLLEGSLSSFDNINQVLLVIVVHVMPTAVVSIDVGTEDG
jgi:hypothetical protein